MLVATFGDNRYIVPKVNIMEDLLFNKVLGGEELVKDILNTDNVSSIRDQTGKSYWWNTIDKKKNIKLKNMNMREHCNIIQ